MLLLHLSCVCPPEASRWLKEVQLNKRRPRSYPLCPGSITPASFLITSAAVSVCPASWIWDSPSRPLMSQGCLPTFSPASCSPLCFIVTPNFCALICFSLRALCTLPVHWWNRSHSSLHLGSPMLCVSLLCSLRPLLLYLWKEANKTYLAGL